MLIVRANCGLTVLHRLSGFKAYKITNTFVYNQAEYQNRVELRIRLDIAILIYSFWRLWAVSLRYENKTSQSLKCAALLWRRWGLIKRKIRKSSVLKNFSSVKLSLWPDVDHSGCAWCFCLTSVCCVTQTSTVELCYAVSDNLAL